MVTFDFWFFPALISTFLNRFILWWFGTKRQHHIQGFVKPGFEAVEEAFRENFNRNWESEGATFAVYHNEKLVVDLWGGYSNSEAKKFWERDTLAVGFSTTKAACSLCLALLVDKGMLHYEDLVTKYWPEFGENGKKNITVKMLVSHQAGLAVLDDKITYDMIRNWRNMGQSIENQCPNWSIDDKKTGYHAITHGFLIDQLIRRVDPEHRSLGQFFREEIADPYGIEFYIGLPEELESRVARIKVPTFRQFLRDIMDLRFLCAVVRMLTNPYYNLLKKSLRNPNWLQIDQQGDCAYNDPKMHGLEIGSAVGIGTARALAKMMTLFNLRNGPLLSPKLFDIIKVPIFENVRDIVLGIDITSGHGFMHCKNQEGNYTIGHTGYGGQNVKLDPQYKLTMAYLHNGLTSDSGQFSWTFRALEKAVYTCLRQ